MARQHGQDNAWSEQDAWYSAVSGGSDLRNDADEIWLWCESKQSASSSDAHTNWQRAKKPHVGNLAWEAKAGQHAEALEAKFRAGTAVTADGWQKPATQGSGRVRAWGCSPTTHGQLDSDPSASSSKGKQQAPTWSASELGGEWRPQNSRKTGAHSSFDATPVRPPHSFYGKGHTQFNPIGSNTEPQVSPRKQEPWQHRTQKFYKGDRVRDKHNGEMATVVSVDFDGDPMVKYDSKPGHSQKYAKDFEAVKEDQWSWSRGGEENPSWNSWSR